MVRRTDRPLQIVRVSFETTRFSAQHLIEAYTALVPLVRRQQLRTTARENRPTGGRGDDSEAKKR